jgi:hypothetical protein
VTPLAGLILARLATGALGDLPASWPSLSAGGLLAIGVLLIVTGGLIPGRTHRREIRALELQVEAERRRADRWEEAALRALGQSEQLMSGVELTRRVVSAMPAGLGLPLPKPDERLPDRPEGSS